ncbi:Negative regulator of differentiation 1 [Neolecta irregularis DAH-3]|uniref:Negative regulator of differentiation 1 n=1 Tax=Neolecta irregularis (strain DAH-3) TaxID=1198029 RepID=A0A1U7LR11_NEOID|nr:Negative regulator of differentiation 1 [Neolecta irregularis DAH-3]|eukprot:OLL25069.1 Negative regulator of differentiation 1 [Neolecta irregularis DAH-3]
MTHLLAQPSPAHHLGRTVYLGNIPADTSVTDILNHVHTGPVENIRMLPEKNCAFISFLDSTAAALFHSDAILKKLSFAGTELKVGWGKPSSVPSSVMVAVQQSSATRNVYLGNLPDEIQDDDLVADLSKFGQIEHVKIIKDKNIGFVHFLSISNAIKAVAQLPQEAKWSCRKVSYGRDRCAFGGRAQQQTNAYLQNHHQIYNLPYDLSADHMAMHLHHGIQPGNRTVYLGNIHPETTTEEICNVVRGGLLQHIRYIPDKHIAFVTFIDPNSAIAFVQLSNAQGLVIHNRRLKIGWGKSPGILPQAIGIAVSTGASRNVYIGNLDDSWNEDRLRQEFQEYGDIELVNTLKEKNCAFVNFTNITSAIKAIEAVKEKDEFKKLRVNYGKDRCGNPPRFVTMMQTPVMGPVTTIPEVEEPSTSQTYTRPDVLPNPSSAVNSTVPTNGHSRTVSLPMGLGNSNMYGLAIN